MTETLKNVSRETKDRLKLFTELLLKWNQKINLVSKTTESQIWHRHIADSLQLYDLTPDHTRLWLDMGSGGGFPGIVIAILAKERNPNLHVTLIESDKRKAVFLHEAVRELDLSATIYPERVENITLPTQDVISARAFTSLSNLLRLAKNFSGHHTQLIFPKGKNGDQELLEAQRHWNLDVVKKPSITDPEAMIFCIKAFKEHR